MSKGQDSQDFNSNGGNSKLQILILILILFLSSFLCFWALEKKHTCFEIILIDKIKIKAGDSCN